MNLKNFSNKISPQMDVIQRESIQPIIFRFFSLQIQTLFFNLQTREYFFY